jgi:hypothetical protein
MMNKLTQKLENSTFVDIATIDKVDTNDKRIMYCINPACVKTVGVFTKTNPIKRIEVCISDQTAKWITTICPRGCGFEYLVPVNPKCPSCHNERYLRFIEDSGIDVVEKLNYAKASLVEFEEDETKNIHTLDASKGFNEGYTYYEKPKVTVEEERKIKKATTQNIYNLFHPEPQDKVINASIHKQYGVSPHKDLSGQQVERFFKNMNYHSKQMGLLKYRSDKWYENSYKLETYRMALKTGYTTTINHNEPKEYKIKNYETMTIDKMLLDALEQKKDFPAWDKIKKENDIKETHKKIMKEALKKLRARLSGD